MDNLNAFVSLNGPAANIDVAKRLIEQDELNMSQLQSQKEHLIQNRDRWKLLICTNAKTRRDELLRRIEEVNNQEKSELARLSAAFVVQMVPLEEKTQLLKAKIDTAKAAIAPIRTLPAEILGNVFREFVELNEPLWILAMVSKSWRQTTLTTPWLWRYLHVGGLVTQPGRPIPRRSWILNERPRCYTIGNRLVCDRLDDLESWAEKSGVVPLDVEINTTQAGSDAQIIKHLLAEPLSSRIHSLLILLSTLGLDIEGWDIGPFPLLRRFSVKPRYDRSPTKFVESISIRSPLVEEFTSELRLSDFLPGHQFWNSIRVLSLGGLASRSQVNQIIGALTVVESILGLPHAWPEVTTPRTTLSHMRAISLACKPEYLARLRFPQLETLRLTDLDPQYWPAAITNPSNQIDHSWQLPMPKLVDLTFFGAEAMWLSRLSAPALQTMAWERPSFDSVQTAFPQLEFPNVKNFSFDAHCNDEVLQSALDCFPNAQVLSVSPGIRKRCGDKWVLALLERLLSGKALPRLRRLTLGNESNRAGTNKLLAKPLIKGLIQSRKQNGTPIEHLEVAWTKRNGKMETIQYVK